MNILLIIYYYFIAIVLVYYFKHAWPKYCPAFALHGVLNQKLWLTGKSGKGDARDDIYHQDFLFYFHLDLFVDPWLLRGLKRFLGIWCLSSKMTLDHSPKDYYYYTNEQTLSRGS